MTDATGHTVRMPDPLADHPFAWRSHGGEIEISHRGKAVTVLRGDSASRFAARIGSLDAAAAQGLMARVTGNFKRGNERR
jgi:hypothetical protein